MTAIYALYSDGHGAQRAVDGLRRAGVPDTEITVISSTPMEDFEFSHINGKNHLWYVACIGGLAGLLGSIALTRYTSIDWPMNVGNMSTIAWWAYLVRSGRELAQAITREAEVRRIVVFWGLIGATSVVLYFMASFFPNSDGA